MKLKLTILFVIAFLASGPAYTLGSWNMGFLSQADTSKETLLVSDVLDEGKTSPDLIKRYGGVALPKTAISNGIQPSQVLLALSRAGADLSAITLLTPADQRILPGQGSEVMVRIKKMATAELARSLNRSESEIHFDLDRPAQSFPQPQAFVDLAVQVKERSAEKAALIVIFKDAAGHTVAAGEVTGRLSQSRQVVVAARNLLPGDSVTATDFKEVMTNDAARDEVVSSLKDLGSTHWQMNTALNEGEPLKRTSLNYSTLMKKGAVVTLVSGKKGFQVRALGRVKEVMDNGASVLVENVDSKKDIVGRPISVNEVQIFY